MRRSISRFLALLIMALAIDARAQTAASPALPEIVHFAPATTDIIFYSDIASLETFLRSTSSSPPSAGALRRIEALLNRLPLDVTQLKKLKIRAVCTFHLRGTDHQLVVLELGQKPIEWVAQLLKNQGAWLKQRGERHFLLFSKTDGVAKGAAQQGTLQLSSLLREGVLAVGGKAYWAVREIDEHVRQRLQDVSSSLAERPEIGGLKRLQFTGELLGPNEIGIEMGARYESPSEAEKLGPLLGRWIFFGHPIHTEQQGALSTIKISPISFAELEQLLCRFGRDPTECK